MNDHQDFQIKDGKKYWSVTTCLSIINKPEYNKQRGFLGNDRMNILLDETAKIGTLFHEAAKKIVEEKGFYLEVPKGLEHHYIMIEEFEKWSLENIVEVFPHPGRLYSDKHLYCGTLDDLYLLKGRKGFDLTDIKTGEKRSYVEAMQLAAYKNLCIENKIITPNNRLILQCTRDGKPVKPIKIETNWKSDFYSFLYAKDLYLKCNKIN